MGHRTGQHEWVVAYTLLFLTTLINNQFQNWLQWGGISMRCEMGRWVSECEIESIDTTNWVAIKEALLALLFFIKEFSFARSRAGSHLLMLMFLFLLRAHFRFFFFHRWGWACFLLLLMLFPLAAHVTLGYCKFGFSPASVNGRTFIPSKLRSSIFHTLIRSCNLSSNSLGWTL